jgi:predicted Zn-dependent protease
MILGRTGFSKLLPFLLFAVFLSGCAAIPVSDEELARMGADVHEKMVSHYGEYDNSKVVSYVEGVGRRVEVSSDYSGGPLTFAVLDTPAVNAFSVPGGYIHVTRGLLTRVNSESELAFVIGHEIGHLTARHSAERISQVRTSSLLSSFLGIFVSIYSDDSQLGNLVATVVDFSSAIAILNYGREAEFEADYLGVKYSFDARYDPRTSMQFLDVLESMEKSKRDRSALSDLLATHPPAEDRIEAAQDVSAAIASGEGSALDVKRNYYLMKIEGIVVGDSLAAGFIEDDTYYNKKYMFVLGKPSGWKLITSRSYLGGLYLNNDNLFLVYSDIPEAGTSLEENAADFLREAFDDEYYEPQFRAASYDGLPAIDVYASKGREIQVRFFRRDGIFYALVYSYNFKVFTDYNKVFESLVGNFSFMSTEVAADIWEDRMRIHDVEAGDTIEEISVKFYGESKYKNRLMEYNGLVGEVVPGVVIKVPSAKYLDE